MKGYELLVEELRKREQEKKVKDIMSTRIITVEPEETLCNAIQEMRENNIHGLLVVKEGKLLGIVSTYDALLIMAKGQDIRNVLVGDVMSREVISIDKESSISDALIKMLENQINRLPVTDNNKLVGIISTTDIINACIEFSCDI